jgi:hypothetical protein
MAATLITGKTLLLLEFDSGWNWWWNRDEICHDGQLVGRLVNVVQSKCRRQVADDGRRMAINKDKNRLRREQEESKRQGS